MLEQLVAATVLFSAQAIDAPALPAGVDKPAGVWIDVRTPEEYQQGFLEGSINIPVQVIDHEIEKTITDRNTPIYLYCRSGNRSGKAAEILHQKGYKQVINYGGYEALKAKGYR
jgi:phage shock protein E